MLNALRAHVTITIVITVLTACRPSLTDDEEMVVGKWQITIHSAVWRYTFSRNHTVTLSLPHDESVDANERNARFDVVRSGRWRIEGTDVVYTEKAEREFPERTTRIPVAELRAARPFPDRNARGWERM